MTAQHRDFSEPNCSGHCLEAIASLGKERAPDLQGPVTCAGRWFPCGSDAHAHFGESKGLFTKHLGFPYYQGNTISSLDLLILALYLNAASRRGPDETEQTRPRSFRRLVRLAGSPPTRPEPEAVATQLPVASRTVK